MYILVHCLIANFGSSQNIAPAITTAIRGGMNVEFARRKLAHRMPFLSFASETAQCNNFQSSHFVQLLHFKEENRNHHPAMQPLFDQK